MPRHLQCQAKIQNRVSRPKYDRYPLQTGCLRAFHDEERWRTRDDALPSQERPRSGACRRQRYKAHQALCRGLGDEPYLWSQRYLRSLHIDYMDTWVFTLSIWLVVLGCFAAGAFYYVIVRPEKRRKTGLRSVFSDDEIPALE